MADHLDSPGPIAITVGDDTANVGPPMGDPKTDITDVYAFLKPGDASKSILVLDVNPLAPLLANAFDSEAIYEINLDTNGDGAPGHRSPGGRPQRRGPSGSRGGACVFRFGSGDYSPRWVQILRRDSQRPVLFRPARFHRRLQLQPRRLLRGQERFRD